MLSLEFQKLIVKKKMKKILFPNFTIISKKISLILKPRQIRFLIQFMYRI